MCIRDSRYATLDELGAASTSANRYYTLQLVSADEDGFSLRATATGLQARDQACRHLMLSVSGANVMQASGPTAAAANPADANRRCWGL